MNLWNFKENNSQRFEIDIQVAKGVNVQAKFWSKNSQISS